MALPRDRFEVAWTATPWDTNPFWIDATPWLLGVSRERGRQPRDAFNRASKLTAWLNNRDGRFTMQNGPATANLAPEAGTAGWVNTVVGQPAPTLNGGWLSVTRSGSAGSMEVSSPIFTGVAASTVYQLRVLAAPAAGGTARSVLMRVTWRNGSGVFISDTLTAATLETGLPLSWSVTSPAGTAQADLDVIWSAVPVGEVHNLTLVAMAASTTALPPYWPNVEPRRPCRWLTDFNGTTYNRQEGLLEALPTEWTDFSEEVATFTAAGRLAMAADVDLPGSVLETTMKGLAPTHWWQLEEPDNATTFYDSGSSSATLELRSWAGGTTTVAGGSAPSSEPAPWGGSGRNVAPLSVLRQTSGLVTTGTANWTIGALCKLDTTHPTDPPVLHTTTIWQSPGVFVTSPGVALYLRSIYQDVGFGNGWYCDLFLRASDGSTIAEADAVLAQVDPLGFAAPVRYVRADLLRHDWFTVIGVRSGSSLLLYVNGELMATKAFAPSIGAQTGVDIGSQDEGAEQTQLEIADAFQWSRALSAAEVATLDAAARNPWKGDSAHTRYDRLPALTGIPAARMIHGTAGADAGHTLGRSHLGGKALTYLHQLARSVRGRMLDTVDGNIELRTGGDLLNMRTSGATFGQQPGDLPYAKVSTDPSFERIVTAARAKTVEGTVKETEATDLVPGTTQTYIERYGRRGPTEGEIGDLLLETDQQAKDFTVWLVSAGKKPDVALDPLVLHPLGDDAVTLAVLDGRLELDKVVTVRKKHPAQTNTITATARIAGINETVTRTQKGLTWSYSLRLEPLDPTPYAVADGLTLADGLTPAF